MRDVSDTIRSIWKHVERMPPGEWSFDSRTLSAGDITLLTVDLGCVSEAHWPAVSAFISNSRNVFPNIMTELAKATTAAKILDMVRETHDISERNDRTDIEFAASIVETFEILRRAEDMIPRSEKESMSAWTERLVMRLAVLEQESYERESFIEEVAVP